MRCKHKIQEGVFRDDGEVAGLRCVDCKELIALGPANDDDLNVQLEIDAARIIARRQCGQPELMTLAEFAGYHSNEASPFTHLSGWRVGQIVAAHQELDVTAAIDRTESALLGVVSELTDFLVDLPSAACLDRVPFVDGELEPAEADEFRAHLAECDECREHVVEDVQLTAQLGTLDDEPIDPATKFGERARQVVVPVEVKP